MSKERLREAIEAIDHVIDRHGGRLKLVLAAAMAYACERCRGFGWIFNPLGQGPVNCPDCAEWRRIADGTDPG